MAAVSFLSRSERGVLRGRSPERPRGDDRFGLEGWGRPLRESPRDDNAWLLLRHDFPPREAHPG